VVIYKPGNSYLSLAEVVVNESLQTLYYFHNDHLGTPRVLTDDNQNVVWAASYTPFGEATVTTAIVTQNLRFPGQYFDQETGLHYNYFRYYDPSTGRYITSDRIGLSDGPNTYAYAYQNPMAVYDPDGLSGVYGLSNGGSRGQSSTVRRASESSGVPNQSLSDALSQNPNISKTFTVNWTTGREGLRIQPTVTKTYSTQCALVFGVGFKATSSVVGTVALQKAPAFFEAKGWSKLAGGASRGSGDIPS
jgi:RHS repeat-associated protein